MTKVTVSKSKLDHIIGFVNGLYEGAAFLKDEKDADRVQDALSKLNELINELGDKYEPRD